MRILPLIESTRYDPTLKKLSNYDGCLAAGEVRERKDRSDPVVVSGVIGFLPRAEALPTLG